MTDNENGAGAAIKTYSFSTDSFDAIERLLVEHSGDNTIMSVKDLLVLVRRAKRLAMQAFDSESALSKVRDELASVQVRLRAAEAERATAYERIRGLEEAVTALRDESVKNREHYRRNAFTAGGAGMPDNEGYWKGKSDESGKFADKLTSVLSAPLTGTEKAAVTAPSVAGDGGEANNAA